MSAVHARALKRLHPQHELVHVEKPVTIFVQGPLEEGTSKGMSTFHGGDFKALPEFMSTKQVTAGIVFGRRMQANTQLGLGHAERRKAK